MWMTLRVLVGVEAGVFQGVARAGFDCPRRQAQCASRSIFLFEEGATAG